MARSDNIVHEVVQSLQAHGVGQDQYRLQNHVDCDALSTLVDSRGSSVEVEFTVEGHRVSVDPGGSVTVEAA